MPYDTEDSSASSINGLTTAGGWYKGRLASTTDRAGKTIPGYDGRGRTTSIARQLVTPSGTLAPRWYVQKTTYDAADRAVDESTGAVDSGAALAITTDTATTFSKRSLIEQITSTGWTVIASVTHDADKKPLEIVYGEGGSRLA